MPDADGVQLLYRISPQIKSILITRAMSPEPNSPSASSEIGSTGSISSLQSESSGALASFQSAPDILTSSSSSIFLNIDFRHGGSHEQ